ncbi:MAG TPA: NAD(P)-dependent oxidoreductase [Acidimicrobiia bacterium]|nr:NAD(P)-dependent oxidoreductase [Acidimicrobiia bacterium]
MTLRVINQLGPKAAEAMKAAVPDVEVIEAGADPLPPDVRADVLFGGWGPHSLDHAQRVDWVHLAGTGIDSFPDELFDGRTVTCARGASAIPIAEFVLAAMLAFEKRLPETWIHEPPERWNFAPLGWLNTRTLGLVGLGGIGVAVAERALPFGMEVRALRRRPEPSPLAGVEVVGSLEELLPVADHLVLAAPATPRTRHLIDAGALELVKPGVHLVNIARGALVDQDALRVALDDGRVAMATLDTVDPEPLPEGHWFYSHPKVRLSAHVSWASPAGMARTLEIFVDNLSRYASGEPVLHVVDADEGY